jgi:hypothetical protein
MNQHRHDTSETRAERVYALLLRLYPLRHRRDYGPLMVQTFRDQVRDALANSGSLGIGFWLELLADVVQSAWSERRSTWEGGLRVTWIWKHFGVVAGLLMGGLAIVGIVLSNVVFPSTESDSEYTALYLLGYVAIFLVLVVIGFVASGNPSRIGVGARAGAVAALLATAIGLATFFVVDNIFLSIVGQQVDKIQGFHQSSFQTMRDYVNVGLVYAVLGMLPLSGAAGAAFGAVGAAVRRVTRGYTRDRGDVTAG